MAEMLGHLGRTGRAVEPDDVDLERVDGAQRRRDLGPGQHPPGELDGDLRLQRHLPADGGHRPPGADDRGLETEQVELGLDQHQIDAAFEQPRHSISYASRRSAKLIWPRDANFVPGPIEPATKPS